MEKVFLPEFKSNELARLGDSAVLDAPTGRLAFTTDSYVVRPLFFRGGDIGRLAVSGTVNDLAVAGAEPVALSLGLIVEEGFLIEDLRRVARSVASTAREAGTRIAAADTKVVERGAADGLFLNTSGVGRVREGADVRPERVEPGDAILVTGSLGDHGVAVLSEREGIAFESAVESDVSPLASLLLPLLDESPGEIHMMRDPTRGGLAAALNEIAASARACVAVREKDIPVRPAVRGACDLLGLDPLTVAYEGKAVIFCAASAAGRVLEQLRAHPLGRETAVIGEAASIDEDAPLVEVVTALGTSRVLAMPYGEELPRIC